MKYDWRIYRRMSLSKEVTCILRNNIISYNSQSSKRGTQTCYMYFDKRNGVLHFLNFSISWRDGCQFPNRNIPPYFNIMFKLGQSCWRYHISQICFFWITETAVFLYHLIFYVLLCEDFYTLVKLLIPHYNILYSTTKKTFSASHGGILQEVYFLYK